MLESQPGLRVSTCRSCQAPIEWATTDKGQLIPLDPGHVPDGNLIECTWSDTPMVRFARQTDPLERRRRAHFVTCPDAPSWRRTRR